MASGINFNRNSFAVPGRSNEVQGRQLGQSETGNLEPSESFQASPAQGTTPAQPIEFKVTVDQLQSASFQATLQTLAASGIPANVVLVASAAESSLNQTAAKPAPQQPAPQAAPPRPAPQPSYHPPTYGGD